MLGTFPYHIMTLVTHTKTSISYTRLAFNLQVAFNMQIGYYVKCLWPTDYWMKMGILTIPSIVVNQPSTLILRKKSIHKMINLISLLTSDLPKVKRLHLPNSWSDANSILYFQYFPSQNLEGRSFLCLHLMEQISCASRLKRGSRKQIE